MDTTGVTYDPGLTPPATDTVTVSVTDGFGGTDTVNFIFNVVEIPSEPVVLSSTTGKDVIFGTSYADQFVFGANSNHDTIIGFDTAQDQIDLSALGGIVTAGTLDTWLQNNVKASPANALDTLITLDANDTLLLKSVSVAAVLNTDFIVHA